MNEKLQGLYLAWFTLGPLVVALGWWSLGRVPGRGARLALRALLVAAVFGFGWMGSHGDATVLVPAWALFVGEPASAVLAIAIWWGLALVVLAVVDRNVASARGGSGNKNGG